MPVSLSVWRLMSSSSMTEGTFHSAASSATSKVTLRHLGAGNAALPPHSDNLIAVVEGHDRLPAVRQNAVQQFAFHHIIGPFVAAAAHITGARQVMAFQPILRFRSHLI